MSLKDKIKNNKRLHYFFRCINQSKRTEFREMVCAPESRIIYFEEKGSENPNQKFLYIAIGFLPKGAGFFAVFQSVLKSLMLADALNLVPVVEYGPHYLYKEDHEINGTENPYEYFFTQPSDFTPTDVKKSKYVCTTNGNKELIEGLSEYKLTDEIICRLAVIYNKYIKLNVLTQNYMDQQINSLLNNKKTLGVHVRGTDYLKNYNNHPVAVTASEYLEKTIQVFETGKYEQIFLATDEVAVVEMFKDRFKDSVVVYNDVARTKAEEADDIPVANKEPDKADGKYLLCREVLRDMLTLASCDSFIGGLSWVATIARIAKRSYGKVFLEELVLDKGVNKNNNQFKVYNKLR